MKASKFDKVNIICNKNAIGEELYEALIGVINSSNIDSKHTIKSIYIDKVERTIVISYSGFQPKLVLPYGTIVKKKINRLVIPK